MISPDGWSPLRKLTLPGAPGRFTEADRDASGLIDMDELLSLRARNLLSFKARNLLSLRARNLLSPSRTRTTRRLF